MRQCTKAIRHTKTQQISAFLTSVAVGSLIPGLATAQSSHVCSAWNVDRSVEVVTPEDGSAGCQVVYRKPDEEVADQILWRSTRSVAFCDQKATELTARLSDAGFECTEGRLPVKTSSGPLNAATEAQSAAAPASDSQLSNAAATSDGGAGRTAPMGGVPYQRIASQTDTSWHLAGYADATFIVSDFDGETTVDFSAARFNPAFHFQYKDLVLLEAEAEIEIDGDGETEFNLEYAQADIFLHDNATLVVGQFLSPVGQFQERLHPTWINRMANPPAGFGHDGVQPASDTGAMLRGGVSIGQAIATYSVAVGNGPRLSHEGGIDFEAKGGDDNPNKALSGRLGFLPLPYFEVGGSFLVADVSGVAELEEGGDDHGDEGGGDPLPDDMGELLPTDAKVKLWGADAAYTRGPWDIRGEYLNATRNSINSVSDETGMVEALPELKLEAWYGQIAYSLSGLTDHKILQRFEPAVRYGEYKIDGLDELAEEAAEKRLSVGLNYWLAPSIVTRGVLELRDFTARDEDDPMSSETRFILQFAYGF